MPIGNGEFTLNIENWPRYLVVYAFLVAALLVILADSWILIRQLLILRPLRKRDANSLTDEECPLVSIVIPARNEERNIEVCLRSVLTSDYPRYEVIVSDDRSSDQTAAIVRRIANQDSRFSWCK